MTTTLRTRPDWVLMRAVSRFDRVRTVQRARARPPIRSYGDSVFDDLDVARAAAALERDGVYTGMGLPGNVLSEVRDFAQNAICYGDQGFRSGFRYQDAQLLRLTVPRFCLTARYVGVADACPAVGALTTDGKLWQLAAEYLRCEPVLQTALLWWSFALESPIEDRSAAAQLFHFDLDDYRFLKFFFYITDVDEDHGPHVVVRGTHRHKRFGHQLVLKRRDDEEITRCYSSENILQICGSAGTGFAEDTRCFHKGAPPRTGDRLVLQLEFGTKDYEFQQESDASRSRRPVVDV
jgi:hypothetical protein